MGSTVTGSYCLEISLFFSKNREAFFFLPYTINRGFPLSKEEEEEINTKFLLLAIPKCIHIGLVCCLAKPSLIKIFSYVFLSVSVWRDNQSINFVLLYIIAHAMSLVHMHLTIPNIYFLNDNDNANSEKRNKNYFLYKIITIRYEEKKQKERWW